MSTHHQKYLFEAGLTRPFKTLMEMSAHALDILAPEDGLEVAKKAKLKGKLNPSEDWTLKKIEYLEGPHGEADYETCENCSKQIRYVCTIMGEDEKIVGPDCALTLLAPGSADAKDVEDYVGKRIKKNKFVKNAIKLFVDSSEQDEATKDAYSKLSGLLQGGYYKQGKGPDFVKKDPASFSTFRNLNSLKNSIYLVSTLISGGVIVNYDSNPVKYAISNYAVREWIKEILGSAEGIKNLSQAFEKVWAEDVSLRNKKYFYDPKPHPSVGFVSDFLEEFKDILGGTKSIF